MFSTCNHWFQAPLPSVSIKQERISFTNLSTSGVGNYTIGMSTREVVMIPWSNRLPSNVARK